MCNGWATAWVCPLAMPAAHPFNPFAAAAAGTGLQHTRCTGQVNRYVAELVLRHVGKAGRCRGPERVAALHATLADHMAQRGRELADPNADAVKQQLRTNTEEALAAGAFRRAIFVVDDKLFWGLDGLPMLKACLQGRCLVRWPRLGQRGQRAGGCSPGVKKVRPAPARQQAFEAV